MWRWLDAVLITVVVLISGVYAVYSLSSIRVKRAMLSLLVRCFGVRVFTVLSPRIGGCDNCGTTDARAEIFRKLKHPK